MCTYDRYKIRLVEFWTNRTLINANRYAVSKEKKGVYKNRDFTISIIKKKTVKIPLVYSCENRYFWSTEQRCGKIFVKNDDEKKKCIEYTVGPTKSVSKKYLYAGNIRERSIDATKELSLGYVEIEFRSVSPCLP